MATLADKKSNHISNLVQATQQLLASIVTLQGLQLEASTAGMGYLAGGQNALVDADFVGANGYLNAAQYNAAVQTLISLNTQLTTVTDGVTPYSLLYALKP